MQCVHVPLHASKIEQKIEVEDHVNASMIAFAIKEVLQKRFH